jgi:hypothetical protein
METKPDDLIPELQQWNNGLGIDLDGYLSCLGNYELAIAFANFFWPTFVEHDGCILYGIPDAKNYADWKAVTNDNRTSIEVLLNHVHILDLFANVERVPTRDQIVYLGRQIKRMWSAKLNLDFPNHDIVVDFSEDCGDDLVEYQITFYQRPPARDGE